MVGEDEVLTRRRSRHFEVPGDRRSRVDTTKNSQSTELRLHPLHDSLGSPSGDAQCRDVTPTRSVRHRFRKIKSYSLAGDALVSPFPLGSCMALKRRHRRRSEGDYDSCIDPQTTKRDKGRNRPRFGSIGSEVVVPALEDQERTFDQEECYNIDERVFLEQSEGQQRRRFRHRQERGIQGRGIRGFFGGETLSPPQVRQREAALSLSDQGVCTGTPTASEQSAGGVSALDSQELIREGPKSMLNGGLASSEAAALVVADTVVKKDSDLQARLENGLEKDFSDDEDWGPESIVKDIEMSASVSSLGPHMMSLAYTSSVRAGEGQRMSEDDIEKARGHPRGIQGRADGSCHMTADEVVEEHEEEEEGNVRTRLLLHKSSSPAKHSSTPSLAHLSKSPPNESLPPLPLSDSSCSSSSSATSPGTHTAPPPGLHRTFTILSLLVLLVSLYGFFLDDVSLTSMLEDKSARCVWWWSWITCVCTGAGALPFLCVRDVRRWVLGLANAFAGGMMLAATLCLFFEGLMVPLPAATFFPATVRVVLGALLGVGFVLVAKKLLEGHDEVSVDGLAGLDARRALLLMAVMTAHSFTEGVGVGVSFGGEGAGEGGNKLGVLIALTLAVHNVPEGLAVALVLVPRGLPVTHAALWAIVSSAPQPVMAVPAFLFVEQFLPLLPVGLGFAGGAMAFVAVFELLREAVEDSSYRATVVTATAAFIVMLAFQLLLKTQI